MANVLYLRKIRDFGERLSDSITFIKFNWKNLVILYLVFVVPFLLVGTLLGASSFGSLFSRLNSGAFSGDFPYEFFNGRFFLAIFLYFISIASYGTAIYLYIRLYEENDGRAPSIAEIGKLFFPKLLSNILYTFLAFLMMMGVFMIAIVPILGWLIALGGFFYLAVNFSILYAVNTIEDNSFPSTISRCFYLIKNNWWFTLGYAIVIWMIYYFISLVLSTVVNLIFGFTSVNFLTTPDNSVFTEKYFLVTGLTSVVTQVFYLIVYVGMAVFYYSVKEEKEGSGLEDRLEQLGTQGGLHGDTEEQY